MNIPERWCTRTQKSKQQLTKYLEKHVIISRPGEYPDRSFERMSPTRDVRARPLLRLLELGAMASFSALAREAVCLNACRMLAGGDRGDDRQNHSDDPGHRCRLSVHEELDQPSDLQSAEDADFAHCASPRVALSGVCGRAGGRWCGPELAELR